jgi:SWI/SNF-related matrix-associated actin-dependent regulator of chromatin subfamily A-like protein 1
VLLDYNPAQDLFFLKVPRHERDPKELMKEYGLSFSQPASTPDVACLFTANPYCAVSFVDMASDRARSELLALSTQIERSWAPSSGRHISLPSDRELWPFQRASVDYLLTCQHGLDGDQPGLGKTPTAIAVANEMQAGRVLVVCPASIRYQWAERILEWDVGSPSHRDISVITSSRRGLPPQRKWTLISWDLVRSPGLWRALAKLDYDLLVLDEVHYAKHGDAKRTRSIFGYLDGQQHTFDDGSPLPEPIMRRAKKVIGLSGTPMPKRPMEAYTMCRHLCWDSIDFMSEDAYAARFNQITSGMFQRENGDVGFWKDEWVGNEAELQNRLRSHFMVRHLKRDVMSDLEYPAFDLVHVEETAAVKQALAAERLLDIDPEALSGKDAVALGHIASARRMMGVAMAPQVANFVRALVEAGEEKIVVFSWHIEVLDIIEARLNDLGLLRVDGRDGPRLKHKKVQEYINDPSKKVFLGNILSLGTGTDGLQHVCSHGVLAEADWIHGNNEQCADRLDRGGQRNKVQFDICVAPGSLAEKVLAVALRDAKTVEKALDRRI